MFKKVLSGVLTLTLTFGSAAWLTAADTSSVQNKSVTDYTYTITPLLAPFNEYFFVQTENPDPTSFRFADKSSKYSEEAVIKLDWDEWNKKINVYEDVQYENKQTGRVNGGYIFESFNTDGGEIVLQSKNDAPYSGDVTWRDTNIKLTLPPLKDDADYLIDTYAGKSHFFDNMDAVQTGFSSICLYSGSYIRGKIEKTDDYWFAAIAGHKDQSFYIYSPYVRRDSKSLFATAIYPFRYDSLGFPGMMGTISKRLDASSTYKWNSNLHYLIDVSYDGETRSYGGAGTGKGQGISEDKITQYFTLGQNDPLITLDSIKQLLTEYSQVEMGDDIPRDDALTWKDIYNTVGDGAWARVSGSNYRVNDKWNLTSPVYAYFYQQGDGTYFSNDEWGIGYGLYWGGDLGYARDTWVDGRYVDEWRTFVSGETFEDHPTSNILLRHVTIPQITYDLERNYNDDTGKYEYEYTNFQITEKEKTVLFQYNTSDNIWIASSNAFDAGCAGYQKMVAFVEDGQIDAKYLDMVTLTLDEVKALEVDRNTNTVPDDYYIYDGTTQPGTSIKDYYLLGDVDNSGTVEIIDALMALQSVASKITLRDPQKKAADVNKSGEVEAIDALMILQCATKQISAFPSQQPHG